jgi:hypothetical protein
VDSRDKGKRGEREAAAKLNEVLNTKAYRSQQFSGADGDADLSGVPGIHVEVKRREKGNVAGWVDQAVEDAADDVVPIVMHRASRRPWLITVRLDDLPDLASAVEALVD